MSSAKTAALALLAPKVVLRDGTKLPLSRTLRGQWGKMMGLEP